MSLLNQNKTSKKLKKYGIKLIKQIVVKNPKDLPKALKDFSFPIAMKIQSPDIIHKKDVDGIALGISSNEEAVKAFNQILVNCKKKVPKAKLTGILIQEMKAGRELIVGGKQDPQFGPIILFGIGGTLVELLKDSSLRVCPINKNDAIEMIQEIKLYPYLEDFRGEEAIDFEKLAELLVKTAKFIEKENVKELDFNPVIANNKEIIIVDARIIN